MKGAGVPGAGYDVVVVGGGILGLGVLWDLSLRGIRALLLERAFPGAWTSGRFHGLLHSGGRYAVSDPALAAECARENRRLRHLAGWCVDARWGLFLRLPGDDPAYEAVWREACLRTGIPARPLPPAALGRLVPHLDDVRAAYRVPDASIDGFNLLEALRLDACRRGACVLLGASVTAMEVTGGRIRGLLIQGPDGPRELHPKVVVNAAGTGAGPLTALAGLDLPLLLQQGTMAVYPGRPLDCVLNRLRPPADGDIIVPSASTLLAGTTAVTVTGREAAQPAPGQDEIELVRRQAAELLPALGRCRVLRVYAGVRVLPHPVTRPAGGSRESRAIPRDALLVDHSRDGVRGLITVVGGKFTTFRAVAEQVADLVVSHLGAGTRSPSARTALPPPPWLHHRPTLLQPPRTSAGGWVLCDCERVTAARVLAAWDPEQGLDGLRRRVRLGMGVCQGALCLPRAAELLVGAGLLDAGTAACQLADCLRERWRGLAPLETQGASRTATTFFHALAPREASTLAL